MFQKLFPVIVIFIGIVGGTFLFLANAPSAAKEVIMANSPFNGQQIVSVYEDKVYNWGGEAMPTTFDAKERLDRELSVNAYWQSNTLLNIKKANRYFPIMERILAEEGVPDDFKYLAVAESDLRSNATSHASAKGFWQFMSPAAKDFNLEVNREVDERYHLEKSTRAAAKYIKNLRSQFGSWTNAAAAYNVGPGNFKKLRTSQGEFSFYDLNLNDETSRYVFRLIAIKEIIGDPAKFGFNVEYHEKYPPLDNYYEVKIDKTVPSWSEFAKEHGVSYRVFKIYNPWLLDNTLTVKNNSYVVKVPRN